MKFSRKIFVVGLILGATSATAWAKDKTFTVKGTLPSETEIYIRGTFVARNPLCSSPCIGGPIMCGGAPSGMQRMETSDYKKIQTTAEADGTHSFNATLAYHTGFCRYAPTHIEIGTTEHAPYYAALWLTSSSEAPRQSEVTFELADDQDRWDDWIQEGRELNLSRTKEVTIHLVCKKDPEGRCVVESSYKR